MDDVIYVVKIGMHDFLATNQKHAVNLIKLLANAQPVNCVYCTENSTETVSAVKPVTISLEVKPGSALSED
ncbi:hypothetical protein GZ77_21100 [Endozoicomonas montiporae]|uniref:Uncharacterized protein n=2 Tax=Endozoicomonas montiporae TaxID=1027273 RepID=A0A081N3B1_9GAMM|nr:hypothetical protein [Endozoicomonas montiporae]AMO58227.1 hypothetical protein EZMO1_4310 [Endozoicomonas montiporae CL-33]KEQ12934.1 hypothetical protein GZ77_21100 [Endozoicomonas montiporae]